MNNFYRIIDANINRASEGIRCAEDIARFVAEDKGLASELKMLRHKLRKSVAVIEPFLLSHRDSLHDISRKTKHVKRAEKESYAQSFIKNISRAEEAVRSAEEALRNLGKEEIALVMQEIRYSLYDVSKKGLTTTRKEKVLSYFTNNIYGLTASKYSRGRDNITVVKAMLKAGVKIIQYREKKYTRKIMLKEAREIRKLTREYNALFIVNDYIDLAIMSEADGIHLGQDDWPVQDTRSIVGENMIIGVSTHAPAQAEEAIRNGADYLGIGPVFSTNTKEDVCDAVGTEYVKYAAENAEIPWVAIGGIKEHNMYHVCKNGARCIAMVTELTMADDIEKKAQSVLRTLEELAKNSPEPLYFKIGNNRNSWE
ncbi:thiamine phosphate synthase [Spirochaetia bacterium 38H-sp]|uniref:Thiamine-phosphate synthase n=1 Tax=Rarispira pelagica TaxID=3141764 RepID=A0ABU9UB65_9SPIR